VHARVRGGFILSPAGDAGSGLAGKSLSVKDISCRVNATRQRQASQELQGNGCCPAAAIRKLTPIRAYDTAGGPCREFTTEALIGGRRETVYGTACRQADGSWKVMN